jgi:hypothetical protein
METYTKFEEGDLVVAVMDSKTLSTDELYVIQEVIESEIEGLPASYLVASRSESSIPVKNGHLLLKKAI